MYSNIALSQYLAKDVAQSLQRSMLLWKIQNMFYEFLSFCLCFFFLQVAIVESHKKDDSESNNDNFIVTGLDDCLNH